MRPLGLPERTRGAANGPVEAGTWDAAIGRRDVVVAIIYIDINDINFL